MRMTEASLYPVIPYLHVQHNWEVTSMSDYVHTDRTSKQPGENRTIEFRLMFVVCYLLFLVPAIAKRLMPWRKGAAFGQAGIRRSVFSEASSAASVLVASSFMGL